MLNCPVLLTATSARFATIWPAAGVMFEVNGLDPLDGYSVRKVAWEGAIAVRFTTTALTPVAGTPLPVIPTVMARVAKGPSGPCDPGPLLHWLRVTPGPIGRVSQIRNGGTPVYGPGGPKGEPPDGWKTWMRLLFASATYSRPLLSNARPCGALSAVFGALKQQP